jgi:hypothetical protein
MAFWGFAALSRQPPQMRKLFIVGRQTKGASEYPGQMFLELCVQNVREYQAETGRKPAT